MKSFQTAWSFSAAALLLLAGCDSARTTTDDTSVASSTVEAVNAPVPGEVAFSRDLSQGEYRFEIKANSMDNGQQLTVRTRRGDALVTDPIRLNVRGQVTDAVMGDLNGNGNPELYVFTSGRSASAGIEGYEFVNRTFRPIQALPQLSGTMATGYRGEDKYEVRGNRLVRTFPVYSGTDASATATGQSQTMEYTLSTEGVLVPVATPGGSTTSGTTTGGTTGTTSGASTSGTTTGSTTSGTTTGTTRP
jgi:hypothetical protein